MLAVYRPLYLHCCLAAFRLAAFHDVIQPSAILFLILGSRSPSFVTVFTIRNYKPLRWFLINRNFAIFGMFIEHHLGVAKMQIEAGLVCL